MGGSVAVSQVLTLPEVISKDHFLQITKKKFTPAVYEILKDRGEGMTRDRLLQVVSISDVYLSFEWGIDSKGRNCSLRVEKVRSYLESKGLYVFVEDGNYKQNVHNTSMRLADRIGAALERCQCFVPFFTERYFQKLIDSRENQQQLEYFQFLQRKSPRFMLPVIFEKKGKITDIDAPKYIRETFQHRLCVNMMNFENNANQNLEELFQYILRTIVPLKDGGPFQALNEEIKLSKQGYHSEWLRSCLLSHYLPLQPDTSTSTTTNPSTSPLISSQTIDYYAEQLSKQGLATRSQILHKIQEDRDYLLKLNIQVEHAQLIEHAVKLELQHNVDPIYTTAIENILKQKKELQLTQRQLQLEQQKKRTTTSLGAQLRVTSGDIETAMEMSSRLWELSRMAAEDAYAIQLRYEEMTWKKLATFELRQQLLLQEIQEHQLQLERQLINCHRNYQQTQSSQLEDDRQYKIDCIRTCKDPMLLSQYFRQLMLACEKNIVQYSTVASPPNNNNNNSRPSSPLKLRTWSTDSRDTNHNNNNNNNNSHLMMKSPMISSSNLLAANETQQPQQQQQRLRTVSEDLTTPPPMINTMTRANTATMGSMMSRTSSNMNLIILPSTNNNNNTDYYSPVLQSPAQTPKHYMTKKQLSSTSVLSSGASVTANVSYGQTKTQKIGLQLATFHDETLIPIHLQEACWIIYQIFHLIQTAPKPTMMISLFMDQGLPKLLLQFLSWSYLYDISFAHPYPMETSKALSQYLWLPHQTLETIFILCRSKLHRQSLNEQLVYIIGRAGGIELMMDIIKHHLENEQIVCLALQCVDTLLASQEVQINEDHMIRFLSYPSEVEKAGQRHYYMNADTLIQDTSIAQNAVFLYIILEKYSKLSRDIAVSCLSILIVRLWQGLSLQRFQSPKRQLFLQILYKLRPIQVIVRAIDEISHHQLALGHVSPIRFTETLISFAQVIETVFDPGHVTIFLPTIMHHPANDSDAHSNNDPHHNHQEETLEEKHYESSTGNNNTNNNNNNNHNASVGCSALQRRLNDWELIASLLLFIQSTISFSSDTTTLKMKLLTEEKVVKVIYLLRALGNVIHLRDDRKRHCLRLHQTRHFGNTRQSIPNVLDVIVYSLRLAVFTAKSPAAAENDSSNNSNNTAGKHAKELGLELIRECLHTLSELIPIRCFLAANDRLNRSSSSPLPANNTTSVDHWDPADELIDRFNIGEIMMDIFVRFCIVNLAPAYSGNTTTNTTIGATSPAANIGTTATATLSSLSASSTSSFLLPPLQSPIGSPIGSPTPGISSFSSSTLLAAASVAAASPSTPSPNSGPNGSKSNNSPNKNQREQRSARESSKVVYAWLLLCSKLFYEGRHSACHRFTQLGFCEKVNVISTPTSALL
jgi:hypothetical protein